MYWQQNYLHLFFLTKICFMKITSALIKNLKASTCPWTQHICNAVWRFLSTALKFTPFISRYFMTNLKEKNTSVSLEVYLLSVRQKKFIFIFFPWCFKLKQFLHTPSLGCMMSCRFSIFVHSLQISSALHHKVHNLSQTPLTRVMHGGLIKLILGVGVCTSLQQQVGNGPVST